MEKNIGVISKDNGDFEIHLKDVSVDESLTFSMVGYESKHVVIGEIGGSTFMEINLSL